MPRLFRRRGVQVSLGAVIVVAIAASFFGATMHIRSNAHASPCNTVGPAGCVGQWRFSGADLDNTRFAAHESQISATNVSTLAPKWTFTTGGDVSATPTVMNGVVYVPDFAGNLFAIDAQSGTALWSSTIAAYNGVAGSLSRTAPAISGNILFIGDQPPGTTGMWPIGSGAHIIAVNRQTGRLLWITQVSDHPGSQITQSPVVYNNVVYVGVSSGEEALAAAYGYPCCSFRSSVVALDASTGQILWQTYMEPAGYSGASVWGSTPVVDMTRGSLYITTGNNYSVPASVQACAQTASDPSNCPSPDDHFDSILALDLTTGAIKWADRMEGYDTWTVACLYGAPWCPAPSSPDYDFGQGASLFKVSINGHPTDVLGAGQKSGIYWAVNPDTGAILWGTSVGPGSALGGMEWGAAAGDHSRIYVQISNLYGAPYTLINGQTTTGGAWNALDAATGKILWQTADPQGAIDPGAITVANGVVFAGSMAKSGQNMYALDAATGAILWGFASGGSVNSGASVVDGVVYWGSGYAHLGSALGAGNNKLYAFSLGGS